jgi:cytochrome c
MDSFRINKILGLGLGTLLFLQTIHIVDATFVPGHEKEAKPASEHAAAAAQPAAADTKALDGLLANASAERGATVAKQCQICHNVEEGKGPKIGPDLYGVVDRPVASQPGFNYSAALKGKGGKWTFAELDKWITNPRAAVPGTTMSFAGLSKDTQRADVIAYLDTLSKNPVPLPKAGGAAAPKTEGAAAPKAEGAAASK